MLLGKKKVRRQGGKEVNGEREGEDERRGISGLLTKTYLFLALCILLNDMMNILDPMLLPISVE